MFGTQGVLAGGGEMGGLMRALDWGATPVGPVDQWPQSLRTALSILLASGYPMYIAWGPSFTQFYNDAFRPILGSTKHPAALGGSTVDTFAEIWSVIGPMFQDVVSHGATVTQDDALMPLDRHGYVEECYFDFSYSPVRDESGGVGGVYVTCSETTERVLGERRLRTLRDLAAGVAEAQTAADACACAASVLATNPRDLPFVLLYLLEDSGQQANLVGVAGLDADPDSQGRPTLIRLDGSAAVVWPIASALETNRPVIVDDISAISASVRGNPWPEPVERAVVLPLAQIGAEQPFGVLVAGVSAHRALDDRYLDFFNLVAGQVSTAIADARANEAERRRTEALAELDRAKTTFFSNVSHEFRTPLTLLLGPLEDLLSDPDQALTGAQRDQLDVAHRNGLRLLTLVNNLLDFARLEAGRLQAMFERVDVAEFTSELAGVFRSAIERAGLRFVVDCPALPGVETYVDRDLWEKIILNLLSNALKFTLGGEIGVRVRAHEGELEVVVYDTGSGIPPDQLPYIFDRFHRVRTAEARTQEGTGIGLALVQELVRLHGGTIAVDSAVGKGTRFTITLLTGSGHLPPDQIGTQDRQVSRGSAAAYLAEALRWLPNADTADRDHDVGPFDGSAARARILVADDNADMRAYIRRLLLPHHHVDVVTNGVAALEAALAEPPDLVLTDVMMPGLDGFGLLRALRQDPRTRHIPIMLLSARAGEEAKIEGLAAGADDYLVKPFSARELLARVDAHVALAGARLESAHREQLARAQAESERQLAQEAVRLRDEFLAAAAHDLRTPLATTRGIAQLLKRRLRRAQLPDADWFTDGLDRIDHTVGRMSALIDQLVEFARLQMGAPLELERQPTDLASVAHQAIADQVPNAPRHRFRVETPDGAPLVGDWDPVRLRRALDNLLANAVKYSPQGGEILVDFQFDTDVAIIRVTDNGVGIPAADLPHVFDAFHRGGNVGFIQGSGIGLGVVQRIVEQHGGSIGVESVEGRGTTFTLRLPFQASGAT